MRVGISIAAFAMMAVLTGPAFACSICRCGDPTFNALGFDGISRIGLRTALDWDQIKKTQGSSDGEFSSVREQRSTLMLAYGFTERFSAFVRLPYAERDLTEMEDGESERVTTSGLADPELYGQLRLWSSPFEGDVGARTSVFAIFGAKTSWGTNDVARDGARVDEHAQPGTGATDWFGGISASYQLNPQSALFASANYRLTGRNDAGYRYGRSVLLNFAYERKLAPRWDAALEANYRHAARDEIGLGGSADPDTGGSMVYVTPRLLFDAGHGWVARVSAQLPISQSGLNGAQDEKSVLNVGVTKLFAR